MRYKKKSQTGTRLIKKLSKMMGVGTRNRAKRITKYASSRGGYRL